MRAPGESVCDSQAAQSVGLMKLPRALPQRGDAEDHERSTKRSDLSVIALLRRPPIGGACADLLSSQTAIKLMRGSAARQRELSIDIVRLLTTGWQRTTAHRRIAVRAFRS